MTVTALREERTCYSSRGRHPRVVVRPSRSPNRRTPAEKPLGQTADGRAQRARNPPPPPQFTCARRRPHRLHGWRGRRARGGRRRRRGGSAPGPGLRRPPRVRLGDGGYPRRAPAELRLPLRLPRLPRRAEPPEYRQHGREPGLHLSGRALHVLHGVLGGGLRGGKVDGVQARARGRHLRLPPLHRRQPRTLLVLVGPRTLPQGRHGGEERGINMITSEKVIGWNRCQR